MPEVTRYAEPELQHEGDSLFIEENSSIIQLEPTTVLSKLQDPTPHHSIDEHVDSLEFHNHDSFNTQPPFQHLSTLFASNRPKHPSLSVAETSCISVQKANKAVRTFAKAAYADFIKNLDHARTLQREVITHASTDSDRIGDSITHKEDKVMDTRSKLEESGRSSGGSRETYLSEGQEQRTKS